MAFSKKWDRFPKPLIHGTNEPPPGVPVHFLKPPTLTALCRTHYVRARLKTKVQDKVTCQACLKLMREIRGE